MCQRFGGFALCWQRAGSCSETTRNASEASPSCAGCMTTTGARAPRVGAGRAPALLLVDFARGWTDSDSPLSFQCEAAVAAARRLLAAARQRRLPIVFTTVAYEDAEV